MERFDIAVLGAGLGGGSAALELARRPDGPSVLVLEAEATPANDRTWSFWDAAKTGWEDLASCSWGAWRVRAGGRETRRVSERYRYHCLPAERFHARVDAELAACPRTELRRGTEVYRVEVVGTGFVISTSAGPCEASWVLDGRPLPSQESRSFTAGELLQHFAGWHVEADRPVFDAQTVTLMDFDVPTAAGEIHFEYVLPFTPRDALVEATWFSHLPHPPAHCARTLRAHLRTRFGLEEGSYRIHRRESGVIPMSRRSPPATGHSQWIRLGTAAGLVKPSTGYAFAAVQGWSRELVRFIHGERRSLPAPRGTLARAMDRLFLSVLAEHPERGPELFLRLFERMPPEALVRFLTDRGSLWDALRVMRCLPMTPFLQQLLGRKRLATSSWNPPSTTEVIP